MSSTDLAAWWGAVTATVVLIWDIYKWRTRGPRLKVSVSPNMLVMGDPRREGKTWVSITVTNVGDRPTTIKGVGMKHYRSRWLRLRNKADRAGVFPNPNDSYPLPRVLNPGEEWCGLIPQARDDLGIDLAALSRTGHLLISLSQSHSSREIETRLKVKGNESPSEPFV